MPCKVKELCLERVIYKNKIKTQRLRLQYCLNWGKLGLNWVAEAPASDIFIPFQRNPSSTHSQELPDSIAGAQRFIESHAMVGRSEDEARIAKEVG